MMKRGFSSEKYISVQKQNVFERIKKFGRLYLEFGGKLCYDGDASRVLPGYKKTTKIELLKNLGKLTLIYCVNAKDIESGKRLGDFDLTYEEQTIKDLTDTNEFGIPIDILVITRYEGEKKAEKFKKRLENIGKKVYIHKEIPGYPRNLKKVLAGFAMQPYIPIKKIS